MSKRALVIKLTKEGFRIDKDTRFKIDNSTTCFIKNSTISSFETIEINVERIVTVREYLDGRIGKYKNEIIEWVRGYLQRYAILDGKGMTITAKPDEFHANDTELCDEFKILCEKENLSTLLKPAGGVVEFVYKNVQSKKVISFAKDRRRINAEIYLAIDWYKTGLSQSGSISQFLHYFIPLEIFVWRFIKDSKVSWRKDHSKKYNAVYNCIKKHLNEEEFEKKKSTLLTRLTEYPFVEALEKYFLSIFSQKEIRRFWQDNSDITENGRWIWGQYAKILKFGIPKNADLFNVIGKLNKIRNDIVHEGRQEVPSEDIFLMENILRRVIRKELVNKKLK